MTSTQHTTDESLGSATSNVSGQDDLLHTAVRTGLVTARELAAGEVELRGSALLLHGRPIAYAGGAAIGVGRGGAAGERRAPSHEVACLRGLADTGLVPLVHGGGDGEVVWTAAIRGETLTAVRGTMADLAEICQRWGAALATVHTTAATGSADHAPEAPRPWLLEPDRLPRGTCPPASGSARAFVLHTLRGDRGLRRAAARLADRWTADHWIHGDLTGTRVLVRRDPELQVRFVGLRDAGLGDPGWDLTGALETVAELTGGPRATWGSASAACLAEYLLLGYRRAGGAAPVDGATRALRIVARCWELATDTDARGSHPATLHPAAGHPVTATRLTERLALARELAARSAHTGLVAA